MIFILKIESFFIEYLLASFYSCPLFPDPCHLTSHPEPLFSSASLQKAACFQAITTKSDKVGYNKTKQKLL